MHFQVGKPQKGVRYVKSTKRRKPIRSFLKRHDFVAKAVIIATLGTVVAVGVLWFVVTFVIPAVISRAGAVIGIR